jgi:hypothetical protein
MDRREFVRDGQSGKLISDREENKCSASGKRFFHFAEIIGVRQPKLKTRHGQRSARKTIGIERVSALSAKAAAIGRVKITVAF